MIRIYKSYGNRIQTISDIESKCWINIANTCETELADFAARLDIPLDFLTDSLDIHERSRVETEGDCILIVFRAPVYDKSNPEIPYYTIPVGIVLKNEWIVTVCMTDVEEALDLFSGKFRHFSIESKNLFVLHLLHRVSYFYLKYLEDLDVRTNKIETELQKATKNVELIKLLNIEKILVYFTTSLKSNQLMMQRLPKIKALGFSDDDLDFLEDAGIDHMQAIEMAEIHSNILSGMMDAFASVISNNLNIVMKFLTAITLILMIPTLIASIYGMNIPLPFQHSPHALAITMGISLVLSLTGVWIFLKNRWL